MYLLRSNVGWTVVSLASVAAVSSVSRSTSDACRVDSESGVTAEERGVADWWTVLDDIVWTLA